MVLTDSQIFRNSKSEMFYPGEYRVILCQSTGMDITLEHNVYENPWLIPKWPDSGNATGLWSSYN